MATTAEEIPAGTENSAINAEDVKEKKAADAKKSEESKEAESESKLTDEQKKKVEELKTQGNAAVQAEDFAAAIAAYSEALDVQPDSHVLLSNRSAAHAKAKNYKEALEDADACIKIKPDWAKGYSRRGAALMLLFRFPEAMDCYEAGLKVDSRNDQLREGRRSALRMVAASKRNPFCTEKAEERLRGNPVTAKYMEDEDFLRKFEYVRHYPDCLNAVNCSKIRHAFKFLLGIIDENENAAAEASATSGGGDTPASSTTSTSTATPREGASEPPASTDPASRALELKNEGNEAYKAGDFTRALDLFSQAIALDDANPVYHLNKSACHFVLGNEEECVAACEDVMTRAEDDYPTIAKVYERMGDLSARKEDKPEAAKWYGKCAAADYRPGLLAKLNQVVGDGVEATSGEKEGAEDGEGGEDGKQDKAAEADLEKLTEDIEERPLVADTYYTRARLLMEDKQWQRALADANYCLEIDPKHEKCLVLKGHLLMGSGEIQDVRVFADALKCFQAALELNPECQMATEGQKMAELLGEKLHP